MQRRGLTKGVLILGISPALLLYSFFVIIPILVSLCFSFYDWNGLTNMKFNGFENFTGIFGDKYFWVTVKNTVVVALSMVAFQLPLGFILAIMVNEITKAAKFFRTLIFFPVTISAVVASLIWNKIYNYQYGLLNGVFNFIGLDSIARNWLGESGSAIFFVCIPIIWQGVGLYMIMYTAALQNVPGEVIESAHIDGARELTRITRIIIPLMKPTIIVTVIYSISNSFRVFDMIYVMTKGGPNHATEVMTIYMYQNAFVNMKYGYGSAVAILILIFSFIMIQTVTRLIQAKED